MKKYKYIIVLLLGFQVACISNDIPYPYIEGEIKEIEVEAQIGEAQINSVKRTIDLSVDEHVELESIKILKLIANKESVIIPDNEGPHQVAAFPDFGFTSLLDLPSNANTTVDFRNPFKILLQTYQDYLWTIAVKQVIQRSVSVENQIGEAVIDEVNKLALVYVPPKQDLSKIKVLNMNLEGVNNTLNPDPSINGTFDFTRPRKISVYRGEKYISLWTVEVVPTEATSTLGDVETWAKRAIVKGGIKTGGTPVVEYKKRTDASWSVLEQSSVEILTSTTFKATIKGLDDGTAYEWRVVVDGASSGIGTFTTEKIQVIPNLNFDTWSQKGKSWYANSDQSDSYWASGNNGVTSSLAGGKDPITFPVEGAQAYKGKAACLKSLTDVTLVGAAAGNLFIGSYKTDAFNPSASVSFGRPFTGARPSKLEGYFKYFPSPINHGTFPGNLTQDQGHIYIKIWDADPKLDPNANLFAEAEYVISDKVETYTKFSIDVKYKSLTARPAVITIVATSSRYGGEFDGARVKGQVGNGSTLYVDEFELIYD